MRLIYWLPLLAVWTAAGASQDAGLWGGRLSEFRLANGLQVAVLERHDLPTVTFQIRVGAGAADEPEDLSGVSRMIERTFRHGSAALGSRNPAQEKALLEKAEMLMRPATPDASRQARLDAESDSDDGKLELVKAEAFGIPSFFADTLDANGASPVRFLLGADSTTYLVTIPSERAEIPFRMWGDWIREPSWRYFYQERNSLRASMEQLDRAPAVPVLRSFYAALFAGHAYEKLGVPFSQTRGMRVSDAKAFFAEHYRPSNIAIAVIGDVTADRVKAWANAHFGSIAIGAAGKAAARGGAAPNETVASRAEPVRVPVRADVAHQIWMGWRIANAGQAAHMVIRELLAGGPASWLSRHQASVRGVRQFRLQSVPGDGSGTEALLLISLAEPNSPVDDIETAVKAMLAGLRDEEITDSDLARARKRVRSSLISSLEDPLTCAAMLSHAMQRTGSTKSLSQLLTQIDAVSREAVLAALGETVFRLPDATIIAGPGQRSVAALEVQ